MLTDSSGFFHNIKYEYVMAVLLVIFALLAGHCLGLYL
jgi:hypothetical protein